MSNYTVFIEPFSDLTSQGGWPGAPVLFDSATEEKTRQIHAKVLDASHQIPTATIQTGRIKKREISMPPEQEDVPLGSETDESELSRSSLSTSGTPDDLSSDIAQSTTRRYDDSCDSSKSTPSTRNPFETPSVLQTPPLDDEDTTNFDAEIDTLREDDQVVAPIIASCAQDNVQVAEKSITRIPNIEETKPVHTELKRKVIKEASKKKLKVGIFSVLLLCASGLMSFWAGPVRLISYLRSKSLFDDMEKCRTDALVSVLKMDEAAQAKRTDWLASFKDEEQAALLVDRALAIRDKIAKLETGEWMSDGVEGIRQDLARCTSMPFYQVHKDDTKLDVIHFIHVVSLKMRSGKSGEVFENYGRKCLEGGFKSNAKLTGAQTMERIWKYFNRPLSFNRNGPVASALHMITHPLTAIDGSFKSNWSPLNLSGNDEGFLHGYDAEKNNPTSVPYTFKFRNGYKMDYCLGPNPIGNANYEHGYLPALREFGTRQIDINYQDTCKSSDALRIQEIQRVGENNSDVLAQNIFGWDTKRLKTHEHMQHGDDIEKFFESYTNYIIEGRGQLEPIGSRSLDNGFVIPETVLTNAELRIVMQKAQQYCEEVLAQSSAFNKLSPEDKASVMILRVDAYLSIAIKEKHAKARGPITIDSDKDPDLQVDRISEECKEDFDRGTVINACAIVDYELSDSPDGRIPGNIGNLIGGILAGRSTLGADRDMLMKRLRVLNNFMQCLDDQTTAEAAKQVSDFRDFWNPPQHNSFTD